MHRLMKIQIPHSDASANGHLFDASTARALQTHLLAAHTFPEIGGSARLRKQRH